MTEVSGSYYLTVQALLLLPVCVMCYAERKSARSLGRDLFILLLMFPPLVAAVRNGFALVDAIEAGGAMTMALAPYAEYAVAGSWLLLAIYWLTRPSSRAHSASSAS